jgi:hypothetical protein
MKKLWDIAIQNPKATNAIVAILGTSLLFIYGYMKQIETPISIFFLEISSSGVSAIATGIKEIGLAALVAVIINFSIEGFNRKRHEKEKSELISEINLAHNSQREDQIIKLNTQMFETIYKRNIPDNFFREIEELLLKGNFMRSNSEWVFQIKKHDENFAKLNIKHRYTIKNISNTRQTYKTSLGFDVDLERRNEFSVESMKAGNQYEIKVQPASTKIVSPTHEWWTYEMDTQIEAGGEIQCDVEYTRLSRLTGKEVICSITPTNDMKVSVITPNIDFNVRGMSIHPRGAIEESSSQIFTMKSWKVDGPLLPGQGFLLDWSPIEASRS